MSISSVKRNASLAGLLILPILLLVTVPTTAQMPVPMAGAYQMSPTYVPGWDPRYSPRWVPMASPSPMGPMYTPWWGSMWNVHPMWRMDPRWTPPVPDVSYYNIPWPAGMMGGMAGMPPGMTDIYSGMMGYGMYPGMMGYDMYPGMMGYGMYPGMMGYGMYPGMRR